MGIFDGVKRSVVAKEIRRLLHIYESKLAEFGVSVHEETCVQKLIELYEAKDGH